MRRKSTYLAALIALIVLLLPIAALAQYLDNQAVYSNQDQNNETRRSDHFRVVWGHYNRDGAGMSEAMAQGNLQMFEQMHNRWFNELGMHAMDESADPTKIDGNKYRTNFHFLMTWNDGGGGGAWMGYDGNGFGYAMANPGYCRYDPPSGATPHEMGHAWESMAGGFNGSDSSGAWWECTANWMQLQFLNSYPQMGAYIYNPMYYPAHGRDYYDTFAIWEAARDDSRFGVQWVNRVWTDYTPDQQAHEYIVERMLRVSNDTGEADVAGSAKDLWGDMAKKMVTWDFERKRWLASANNDENSGDPNAWWTFYQRCRTPLVKVPGVVGTWYRPERSHIPMEYGINFIPLTATAGTTVSCNFQPQCDPVRQSDWRACFVAVNTAGEARYSTFWSTGTNSMTLSTDETKLFLVVIATPKAMKFVDPVWQAYLQDAGLQFPYAMSFTNTAPKNVVFPTPSVSWKTFTNADGTQCTHIQSTATVDTTCYVSPNAMVLDSAQVKNYARIEDYAVVRNSAQVRDYAVVSGHAVVQDNARVYGNAKVRDWARVFGWAEVYENGKVLEHANCGDGNSTTHTKVYNSAVVKGTTYVYDTSIFTGCIIVDGDSANGNGTSVVADHGVHFGWQWGQNTGIFAQLVDNGYVWAQHDFERDNPVFAMDKYGINQGFLINGARAATVGDRGGRVLPLDGVSQYVELHNTVNDFRETAISVWVKWTGTGTDQRIWSMGDGANKVMYLTPADDNTGALRFVISNGTTTQTLNGAGALPANTWTHVAVTFGSPVFNTTTRTWSVTGTLYVNGAQVATQAGMLAPDSLNAPLMENANYIGRGNAGNYFQGCVDDFRVYMKTLAASDIATLYSTAAPRPVTIAADSTAPTPNAATWLSVPKAVSDTSVTMSATPGTDESNWVEYYFTCTSGGGHDSGWVSFNKYTDVGLTPGTAYTYTVAMRDKNGNTTTASTPAGATTQVSSMSGVTASFAYGPVGRSNSQITMTATKLASPSGLVEYKFDRSGKSSGWQSSATWTDTGLTTGSSYSYTVTARDGRGNVSATSSSAASIARDLAAPQLPITVAHWRMQPYPTLENKLCMSAQGVLESGCSVYYQCTSGNGPDSGWLAATTNDGGYIATWTSSVLADGTYTYRYKVKDAAGNESPYSVAYSTKITPTTGYHAATVPQCLTLPDDCLVQFAGTVMKVYPNYYVVKDLSSGATVQVRPNAGKNDGSNNEVTDPANALKNVVAKGHLYTFSGQRVVTYSTVTAVGDPTLYTISGKVTDTNNVPIAGATVYISDTTNAAANPLVTATTDSAGNYSKGVTNGTWYVAAGAAAYNTAAEKTVVVNNANVVGIDFKLVANKRISGKVTKKSDGTPVAGASVYFSKTPGATASPTFTATTDSAGNYSQAVQDGTWYVAAGGTGYYPTSDQTVVMGGADIANINFVLSSNARNIPRTDALIFGAVTESLPSSGATGNWPTLYPSGSNLAPIGTPVAETINGVKWEKNVRSESIPNSNNGYNFARYASPLAVNGVTIIAAVKPKYVAIGGEARGEIVDIFYNRLALAVSHTDGRIMVCNNRWNDWGPAIPDGQTTVLTLVVQPGGAYTVWANGVQQMTGTYAGGCTSIDPSHIVDWGNDPDFTHYISVGRNAPDGWSAFNGNIGDVFLYNIALLDTERAQLEADLTNKFLGAASWNITASAGAGGTVTPAGTSVVSGGGSKTINIAPAPGYSIANVLVDGVSQGAITSYTFTNVQADHWIAASFTQGGEPVSTIAALKAKAADTIVTYTGSAGVIYAPKNVSSARTTTYFYIGEAQGLGGLKVVDKTADTLSVGNGVTNLVGYVRKPAGKEVYLELISDPSASGSLSIAPIGINNDAATNDAKTQTNAVKVWGKVLSVNGTTSFVISDGYNAAGITVTVNGVALPAGLDTTKYAVVTGVLTRDDSGALVVLAQTVATM